jgi:hypothetical protein
MVSLAHGALGVSLAAASLLGVGVRTGRVELGPRRWLHHVAYATSLATAVGAVVIDGRRRRTTWPVAAATLGVLSLLPTTRGGSRLHLAVAVVASSVYAGGTIATTTRR